MARNKSNKKLRFKFAVLGDGRTEQYYLAHLKTLKSYGYSVKPSLFDNITLSQSEEIIEDLLEGGCDKIIFLTDFDTVVNQNKKEQFNKLVKKYTKNKKVIICETMPSIEFWFLLHYQYTTKLFQNAKEVENALKKYIPEYSKEQNNFLKNIKWVEQLCSNGKFENAIKNGEKTIIEKNKSNSDSHLPFTKMSLCIEEFEKNKK